MDKTDSCEFPTSKDVEQIATLFPDLSRQDIRIDLRVTRNVESTINRILDGNFRKSDCPGDQYASLSDASSDDEDLPPANIWSFKADSDRWTLPCNTAGSPDKEKQRRDTAGTAPESTVKGIASDKDLYSDTSDLAMKHIGLSVPSKVQSGNLQEKGTQEINLNSDSDDELGKNVSLSTKNGCEVQEVTNMPSGALAHTHEISSDEDDVSSLPSLSSKFRETVPGFFSENLADHRTESSVTVHDLQFFGEERIANNSLTSKTQHLDNEIITDSSSGIARITDSQSSAVSGISYRSEDLASTVSQESVATTTDDKKHTCTSDELHSQDSVSTVGVTRKRNKRSPEEMAEAKRQAELKKAEKERLKADKAREREERKTQKQQEQAKKRALHDAVKSAKPTECLKFITAVVHPGFLQGPAGPTVLSAWNEAQVKYEISHQTPPNTITWWREVTEVKDSKSTSLETYTREVVQDEVLVWVPLLDFIHMVHKSTQMRQGLHSGDSSVSTLGQFIKEKKVATDNRNVTLMVQGVERYFRDHRPSAAKKKKTCAQASTLVSRIDIEEALLEVQLESQANVRFVETDQELGQVAMQYTKAVAETPFKRGRLDTGFSIHMEGGGGVRLDKDGQMLSKLWRQQLQQFKNVSAEVANAIIAAYPSPRQLYQAYQNCQSEKESELLLQDLMVRRGVGVLETSRRVGKELSRRIHQLMSSTNPDHIIR